MDTYKLLVLWAELTPMVTSRIVRDLLSLQRLAQANRCVLEVGCDEELDDKVKALGLTPVRGMTTPDSAFVYCVGDSLPPELEGKLPENEGCQLDIKFLTPNQLPAPGLVVEPDPYAGVWIPEERQSIPETMPIDRPAPRGKPGEPPLIPFL